MVYSGQRLNVGGAGVLPDLRLPYDVDPVALSPIELNPRIDPPGFVEGDCVYGFTFPISSWCLTFVNENCAVVEGADATVLFDGEELGRVNLSGVAKSQVFGIEVKRDGWHHLTVRGKADAILQTVSRMYLKRTA